MAGRLDGKTAIVVGAGQTPGETIGNGRATALLFAREGARLLLVDRDESSVRETQELIDREGGSVEVHVGDITREDDCRALVERARETLDRIDVLHNNVGIGAGDGRPTEVELDAWERIVRVNVTAMWLTCRYVVPVMQEQQGGAIVNISSVAAVAAATNLTAYRVSKAGVNALTLQLAIAHAKDGIRVNAIMPGLIDTPMAVDAVARLTGLARADVAAARAARVPLGRQGSAWDIAHAALFLASDEAAFVTGAILPVDGGQAALVG
jgi:NAD(P)-dependent dehydrogenase (short-subunit alcohol dehydrogenase family)